MVFFKLLDLIPIRTVCKLKHLPLPKIDLCECKEHWALFVVKHVLNCRFIVGIMIGL